MEKILKNTFILLVSSLLGFGSGIGVAEIKIRSSRDDQPKVAVTVPEKGNRELKAVLGRDDQSVPEEIGQTREASQKNDSPADKTKDDSGGNKFSFAVIGDTQYFKPGDSNGGFQKAVGKIKGSDAGLVLTVGDMVSSCDGGSDCKKKLDDWKKIMGDLMPKTYVVQGNHDRIGGEKADDLWQKSFNMPGNGPSGFSELAYSFDLENSHFVVLDSQKPEDHVINKTQRNWLEQNLSGSDKEHTFVIFHEPAFPVSSKIGESLDVDPSERNALWDILTRHNVTAVFSGHEHITSRKKIGDIYQFIFGNTDSFNHDAPKAGMAEWSNIGHTFGMVKIEGSKIIVETYSIDGKVINSFQIPQI